MRRTAAALSLAVLALFVLAACRGTPPDLFAYQERAAKIEGTLSSGEDAFGVTVTLDPWNGDDGSVCRGGRIVFTAPEELSSLILEFSAASVYVISGDVRIPLAAGSLSGVTLLSYLFCLDGASAGSIETVREGERVYTVVLVRDDRLRASVRLDRATGLPVRIEAVADGMSFALDITHMEIME